MAAVMAISCSIAFRHRTKKLVSLTPFACSTFSTQSNLPLRKLVFTQNQVVVYVMALKKNSMLLCLSLPLIHSMTLICR
ncbi:hypothetical protein IFM89_009802 [Coptis chinensis]|uniref:Uncharacterized protein n=1 Tax=Coptis chinensis TaxID=261450 RepID=A0A835I0W4_9MAGN|nr:hypothetical protein IFM89_009802 [Coptis chinensis]